MLHFSECMNVSACVCMYSVFYLLKDMRLKIIDLGKEVCGCHLYVISSMLIHVFFDKNDRILVLGDKIGGENLGYQFKSITVE